MRVKVINLKKYNFTAAKRVICRLKQFILNKKYKIQLKFILPEKKKITQNTYNRQDKFCPNCGSHLVKSINNIICNGDNLKSIANEIRLARLKWGDSAELFLSKRANRFYDAYMLVGRTLECGYIYGYTELQYKKGS